MGSRFVRGIFSVVAVLSLVSCSNPWNHVEETPTISALRESLHQPGRVAYGNYCGFGTIDGTLRSAPIDRLDAICQKHDICYIEGQHHCRCDTELRAALETFIEDPTEDEKAKRRARVVRSTFSLPFCKLFPEGIMPPRDRELLDEVNPGAI